VKDCPVRPEHGETARRSVLHCIPSMGGGGAERQVTYLAAELGRLGWAVHVATCRRGPNWERLVASGATIHEVPLSGRYDLRALGAMRAIVRAVRPDLVQVWMFQMDVLGGTSALVSGIPWIFSERASAPAYPLTIKNLVRRGLGSCATAVISNSVAGDAYWRGRTRRRFIVSNGLPLGEIAAAPAIAAHPLGERGRPVVLFAGRFEPQKNIGVLLEALDIVLRRLDVDVLCCGDGPLRADAERWAAAPRTGPGRVVIGGYSTQLWGLMKGATMLVSPTLFEGCPNVVLEGMACGVPLVVSDIPEHRELLDESAAILVPPHSAPALAAAIETALADRPAALARAQVAQERASRHSLSAVAQQYDVAYRQVLRGRMGS
jgi:glycosyltransferase involved in cell wall biosynthesis